LTDEAYEKARSHYQSKVRKGLVSKNTSFSRFVTELLEHALENEPGLSLIQPLIRTVGTVGDSIIVCDRSNRVAEVKLVSGKKLARLFCALDERDDCDHVGFVFSTPELYSLIRLKKTEDGFKLEAESPRLA
jgi:hypothetical protein